MADLMNAARLALHVSQNGLAERMGVSRRTGQRWNAGRGPVGTDIHKMARIVYPADPTLAAEIAAAGGVTLEALGVIPPAPPPPPPLPAPVPQAPPPPPDRVVDAVVCAAAEAMQVAPQTVRPALLAAFSCAGELGLTLGDVVRVLRLPR
jgi:DNA-binding XRE family transcriptional regulator